MFIPLGRNTILIIHNYVVTRLVAVDGVNYEGMIQGSIERSQTEVFGEKYFPDICDKAGSILYSIVRFHPFIDGCKRTALLSAYFLLFYNGFEFTIPNDSADFLEAIADPNHPNPPDEKEVIEWVKKHSRKTKICRLINWMLSFAVKHGFNLETYTKTILEMGVLPASIEKRFKDKLLEAELKGQKT